MNVIKNLDQAGNLIRKRKSFRSATRKTPYGTFTSMSGVDFANEDSPGNGQLPDEYRESFYTCTYAVYSYETPIAWWIDRPAELAPESVSAWLNDEEVGHWVMPEVKYSVTTTKHQGDVRGAIGGHVYGLYGKNPDGTTNYSSRPPAQAKVDLKIDGAPAKVDCSVERSGW